MTPGDFPAVEAALQQFQKQFSELSAEHSAMGIKISRQFDELYSEHASLGVKLSDMHRTLSTLQEGNAKLQAELMELRRANQSSPTHRKDN